MAHFARITFSDGPEYTLVNCDYDFTQPKSTEGQPTGRPVFGTIKLVLVTPDDEDLFLFEWMRDVEDHKEGEIYFEVVNEGKTATKTLKFEGARCTNISESFGFFTDTQMYTTVSFEAKKVTFGGSGGVVFEKF